MGAGSVALRHSKAYRGLCSCLPAFVGVLYLAAAEYVVTEPVGPQVCSFILFVAYKLTQIRLVQDVRRHLRIELCGSL
jgi:hypothetical protein